MPIVPTGFPVWTRLASFVHYGGDTNKQNYLSRGAINALTDVAAEEFSRMVTDLAAVARVAPFMVATVQCRDSSPGAPDILYCSLMTGVRILSYNGAAPPSGFPAVARNGNGEVTFTFAASYLDEYGVAGAFAPQTADATLSSVNPGNVPCVISGQTVRCRAFDGFGVALSDAKFTLEVG